MPRMWTRFDMLVHEYHNSPGLVVQRLLCSASEGWQWAGIVVGSCCCLVFVVSRGYLRCSSRDVAINTPPAGHADLQCLLPFPTTDTGY